MIRVRDGDRESILTMDEFERRARRGDIPPHVDVCIPQLTGEQFLQARDVPLFAAVYDPRRALFRRHFTLGRLPLVTLAVALVCVALLWQARALGAGVVTREALLALGAKARARIVDEGETWRLLTANLLHRDGTHLGFNLFAFLNVGAVLEGVYRRGDYLLLLVVTGLSAMALSTGASAAVTVGASGMIFGCLGCAAVFGLRFADVLPARYRAYFGVVVIGYAAAMFWLGLLRDSTDNWGHAGGLLAGLVVGALLEPRLLRLTRVEEPPSVVARPWALAAVLCIVVAAAGPLVARAALRFESVPFDAFGVVLQKPSTWSRGEGPLGLLTFGNGVDALASVACARVPGAPGLDAATRRFVDGELMGMSRSGQIAELEIGATVAERIGGDDFIVDARLVPFSFIGHDGPFDAEARVFARGEIECALVTAARASATPAARALLLEVNRRLRFVPTRAERDATRMVRDTPDSVKAWLELALAHQTAGSVDDARAAFFRARALLPREPSWTDRVRVGAARFELWFGGRLDEARADAQAAAAAHPDDADAAFLLLDVLRAQHEDDVADALITRLRAHFPRDPRVTLIGLGSAAP